MTWEQAISLVQCSFPETALQHHLGLGMSAVIGGLGLYSGDLFLLAFCRRRWAQVRRVRLAVSRRSSKRQVRTD